jgi:predicted Zn finger-like uncharacterized protein
MQIICETCSTRYSIDDNLVSGKAAKTRCKNCDHTIIVRGKAAPVTEPVPEGPWHVVADGTHRPVTAAELHRLRATGELDDKALVWREGWSDWRELGMVDELRDASPPIEAGSAAEVAPAPAATPALTVTRPVLRNERSETSVLFSLGSLARLAAPVPARAPVAAASGASGEGSGLLDIRALARTMAPAAARGRADRGSPDGLPVYGPVTFVEPAVLIPAKPPARDRRLVWAFAASIGMLAMVTAILVVITVRGSAPTHVEVSPVAPPAQPTGPSTPPMQPANPVTASAPPARSDSAPAVDATSVTATPTATGASVAQASPPAELPGAQAARATQLPIQAAPSVARLVTSTAASSATPPVRTTSSATASRRSSARASSSQPIAPVQTPSLQPQRGAESCSEVTCIVNSYADRCCEIYRGHADSPAAPPPPDPRLPGDLDRPAIAAGLARIDTRGCRDQSTARGDVTVSIKVSPAGAVTAVTVRSSPDPALSACVTAAVRNGMFAQTQRGSSFAYVWRF